MTDFSNASTAAHFRAELCPMSRWGLSLQLIALALISGGMLALGAISAPVVFSQLQREMAGNLMGLIFARFDTVLAICLGLLWLGEALRIFGLLRQLRQQPRTPDGHSGLIRPSIMQYFRGALLLTLTGTMLYAMAVLNPAIHQFKQNPMHRVALSVDSQHLKQMNSPELSIAANEFNRMHKMSETLYKADMLIALLLLAMTPFSIFHPLFLPVFRRQPGPVDCKV